MAHHCGPCRDEERDGGQQHGTREQQPPRAPPLLRDMSLHPYGQGAGRRLAPHGCGCGGAACEDATENGLTTSLLPCLVRQILARLVRPSRLGAHVVLLVKVSARCTTARSVGSPDSRRLPMRFRVPI